MEFSFRNYNRYEGGCTIRFFLILNNQHLQILQEPTKERSLNILFLFLLEIFGNSAKNTQTIYVNTMEP